MEERCQNHQRGMTLVEVVVAMTLVIVISFAALSTVLSAAESFENQSLRQYAVNEADNILSCLQSGYPEEALMFAYSLTEISYDPTEMDGGMSRIFDMPGIYRLMIAIPSDYYLMRENDGKSAGEVRASIRKLGDGNRPNAEEDPEIYADPENCSVKVVVYIQTDDDGEVRITDLIADARYVRGGTAKLRRAYRMTSGGLTLISAPAQTEAQEDGI